MKKATLFSLNVLLIGLLFAAISPVQAQVPEKLKAMVGTYTGEWTLFGMDKEGNIVEKVSWTDVIEVQHPVVEDNKAYVTTVSKMHFGDNIPPHEVKGIEGYYLKADGSLGDYFIQMQGQEEIRSHEVGKDVWVYAVPISNYEYAMLGFSNATFGRNVLVKVVARMDGLETHRIHRVTTVAWKDDSGRERWTQFVSLKGFHQQQR